MTHDASKGGGPVAGYSSYVQLTMLIEGKSYSLSQIGPDFVRLREPAELNPCDAEVVMKIDGTECQRWPVFLEHGAVPSDLDVATVDR